MERMARNVRVASVWKVCVVTRPARNLANRARSLATWVSVLRLKHPILIPRVSAKIRIRSVERTVNAMAMVVVIRGMWVWCATRVAQAPCLRRKPVTPMGSAKGTQLNVNSVVMAKRVPRGLIWGHRVVPMGINAPANSASMANVATLLATRHVNRAPQELAPT